MDETDIDNCPICMDKFKTPKLLPCRHTFCAKCLQQFAKSFDGNETLTCPMCRTLCVMPSGGVYGFMDNYFVPAAENFNDITNICAMCKVQNSMNLIPCSHCGQNMCTDCASSHKLAITLSRSSVPSSDREPLTGSDTETELDGNSILRQRRDSSEVSIPFLLQLNLDPIHYLKSVSLVSCFKVDLLPTSSDHQFINCVCPISTTECWVLPTLGPTLLRYNISGDLKQVIPIHDGKVSDVVYRKDGSLLLALVTSNKILKYADDNLSVFTSTGRYHPYGLTTFIDGRVAVVGNFHPPDDESIQCGELQIYSSTGDILKRACEGEDEWSMKSAFSVAVSEVSSRVFVCDRDLKKVFIFSDDGILLNYYNGGKITPHTFLFRRETSFDPMSARADISGNVVILDISGGDLHILDNQGKFLGLVLTNHMERFGRPFSIAIDEEGKLWIGDTSDWRIRVYNERAFVNSLVDDPYVIPSLPSNNPLDFQN